MMGTRRLGFLVALIVLALDHRCQEVLNG